MEIKKWKITALSDTHSSSEEMQDIIRNQKKGDIFIFAGDFTRYGKQEYFHKFFKLLQKIDYRHKIVIAGNHQISLDNNMKAQNKEKLLFRFPCNLSRQKILSQLKKRCIYLQHQFVEIQGIKIFGSPYTLKYSKGAFQYNKAEDETIWNTLPQQIDLLITHLPPYGILDLTNGEKHAGSQHLLKRVTQIKPKYHIFGHIHEAHGLISKDGITFINVAKKAESFVYER